MDACQGPLARNIDLCISCTIVVAPTVANLDHMLADMVVTVVIFDSTRRNSPPKIPMFEQPNCQLFGDYDDSSCCIKAELIPFHPVELRTIIRPDKNTLSLLGLNISFRNSMGSMPFALSPFVRVGSA
jgi:hypothetical protein